MKEEYRFVPAGVIICAVLIALSGAVLSVIATPVLVMRGGVNVSAFGATLYTAPHMRISTIAIVAKACAGLLLVGLAIGLMKLEENARMALVAVLVFFGIIAPFCLTIEFERIDHIFVVIIRGTVFLLSAAIVAYLSRPALVRVFAENGVVAHYVYRYCPICATRGVEEASHCPHCEGALLDRFEADDGVVFARPVADPSSATDTVQA